MKNNISFMKLLLMSLCFLFIIYCYYDFINISSNKIGAIFSGIVILVIEWLFFAIIARNLIIKYRDKKNMDLIKM